MTVYEMIIYFKDENINIYSMKLLVQQKKKKTKQ